MTTQLETVRDSGRLQLARSFFVQTPLLNPGFGGTGKWTVVVPESRKLYQAAQVDRYRNPALFNLFRRVSAGELHSDSVPGIDKLMAAGLILEGTTPVPPAASYIELFHEFVTDYPFYDYSEPSWLDDDIQRMRDYKAAELPPPISTPRSGAALVRPDRPGDSLPDRSVSVADEAAEMIERTFGAVGSIEGFPVGPWHRKVVPSGGARHPVEAWIEVPRRMGWLPAGLHVYDVAGKCLRETGEFRRLEPDETHTEPDEITVYLRARVDRAMWRYRDARSWRAILIDAGHCAQALAINAHLRGWSAEISVPGKGLDVDQDWLEEPWLLAVALRKDASESRASRPPGPQDDALVVSDEDEFITQPFVYGTFSAGQMYVHNLATGEAGLAIDELDLAVLTHCMYSRRNDRRSGAHAIAEIFGHEGAERRLRLAAAGALWPRQRGLEVVKRVRAWSDKGWYLTALAHADVRSSGSAATLRLPGDLGLSRAEVDQVAASRRTCRTFDPDYVLPRPTFDTLLESLGALLSATPFTTTVIVAPTAVTDLPPRFYRFANGCLEDLQGTVDRHAISSATIGQSPAGSGAVTLWIAVDTDGSDPGSYELRAATLGMAGQRLCTVATNLGLGVFLTPAVKDSETSTLIGLDLRNALTYTLTIGRNTATATTQDRHDDAGR